MNINPTNKENVIKVLENAVYALYLRGNVGNPIYEESVLEVISEINYILATFMVEDENG